jgi:hypothetical protein
MKIKQKLFGNNFEFAGIDSFTYIFTPGSK